MQYNRLTIVLLVSVLVVLGLYFMRPEKGKQSTVEQLPISDVLSSTDLDGYARALQPREFHFPEDFGPHPEYKTEWWYYTGNVDTEQGRHFGYQLTFFRIAMAPPDRQQSRDSNWATKQIYMAHFAVSDIKNEKFYYFQKFSRNALGLAGAQASPFRVWLEDWEASTNSQTSFAMKLHAAAGEVAVDLRLVPVKPLVLQGNHGLSQKSSQPGNASYYYSFTRLSTKGAVKIGAQKYKVSGLSWMDREWSTSALSKKQEGWDWFSLQLSNGTDLMYYQLRRKDGTVDPLSQGTFIDKQGASVPFGVNDVQLKVLNHWQSPTSGVRYPSGWRLKIPEYDISLTAVPLLQDQELNLSVRYWEGAVRIEGIVKNHPVSGYGYVELAGYKINK